jgi:hypothetical protein
VFIHCIQHFCTWFCHWPIAAAIGRASACRSTPRPSHVWQRHTLAWPQLLSNLARHSPGRPQPPTPRSGRAPASRSQPRGGRTLTVTSPCLAGASCTKDVAGRAPKIHSWSSLRFIGELLLWSFVHPTKR